MIFTTKVFFVVIIIGILLVVLIFKVRQLDAAKFIVSDTFLVCFLVTVMDMASVPVVLAVIVVISCS